MPKPQLNPGEHNIESRRIGKKREDGSYRLQWTIRLWDGRIVKKNTARRNVTKGELREIAIAEAEDMLLKNGEESQWDTTKKISDFITKVSIPAVENDRKLKERTVEKYRDLLTYLSNELKGYPIASAFKTRVFSPALDRIAAKHGTSTAKKARTIAKKWIGQLLYDEEVFDRNILYGINFKISVDKVIKKRGKGGVSLPENEYNIAVEYMLSANPNDPQYTKPKRGRFTQKQLANKRDVVLDVSLLQATTGLRIGECRILAPNDVFERNGKVYVAVYPEGSKTDKGREIPILSDRVAKRILKRAQSCGKRQKYLFPSPAVKNSIYDRSNLQKALTQFLQGELADNVKSAVIEAGDDTGGSQVLYDHSSHIWRTTLNTMAMHRGLSAEERAPILGHDEETNKQYYINADDTDHYFEVMQMA